MNTNRNNRIIELILKSNDIDDKTKLEIIKSLNDPSKKDLSPFFKSFIGAFSGKIAADIFKHLF